MQHGGFRSFRIPGRHWVTPVVSAMVLLTLAGASGPADVPEQPLKHTSTPRKIISRPDPVVVDSPDLIVSSSIVPDPASADSELLHDADESAPHPVSISIDALIMPAKPRVLVMEVTAYCPCKKCCGPHATGITSSGRPITYNSGKFVAADLKVLPYGTRVIIPGYNDNKPVEVIDRGGAIRGNHIDIFMQTHEQAVDWGKKRLEVKVLE